MPKRLAELYALGDWVEIDWGEAGWRRGRIINHDYRGVWVQTEDGRPWFVTNGRKIRRQTMKEEIAQRLINLNRQFYDALAEPFSATRQTPQPGFERLLTALPQTPVSVLDVGCGNGRFGHFLAQYNALSHYAGVDFSGELLTRAAIRVPGDYFQRDLSQPGCLNGLIQYDAVVCLAVLQHIPGHANRVRLLREMKDRLGENGRLILSTWQFMDSERQRRKLRDWVEIGLSVANVEPNDYLLTWQRDGFGLRYVCYVDEAETKALAQEANLTILDQFRSDGKEGNLNLYTVLS